ncbi:MAG TPA: hypothetical protein VEF36_01325 [Roseiarcus sp.]|nr:hypothetical protein [Roseiarcus sp.]
MPAKWKKITAARYWEMLEILPPALMTYRGFLLGEARDHDAAGRPRFTAFVERVKTSAINGNVADNDYFESTTAMTVAEFKDVTLVDVLDNLA